MPEELDDEIREMYEDPKRRTKTLSNEVLGLPIKVLRLQQAITVTRSTSVQAAVETMQQHKIGYVLQTESGKLSGIFTERDLLYKVVGKVKDLAAVPVSDFMTVKPECMRIDDSIGHALHLMHVGGYRHIPVVNEKDEPIGVVSVKDAVAFLSEYFPDDVLNISTKPLKAANEREGA